MRRLKPSSLSTWWWWPLATRRPSSLDPPPPPPPSSPRPVWWCNGEMDIPASRCGHEGGGWLHSSSPRCSWRGMCRTYFLSIRVWAYAQACIRVRAYTCVFNERANHFTTDIGWWGRGLGLLACWVVCSPHTSQRGADSCTARASAWGFSLAWWRISLSLCHFNSMSLSL